MLDDPAEDNAARTGSAAPRSDDGGRLPLSSRRVDAAFAGHDDVVACGIEAEQLQNRGGTWHEGGAERRQRAPEAARRSSPGHMCERCDALHRAETTLEL